MANELRIEAQLEYSKSGVKESRHDSVYIDVPLIVIIGEELILRL